MSNFNDFTAHGYEVIRELGANRGAGRIAYLAREIDSEKLVVIKQFQFAQGSGWDGHKEIDREVKILQQLKHPNIPRYLSSFETPQSSCIVQEYIDGKPLSEIISNQQLYTPEQVKEIILNLLEVLVYLQKTFTDPVLHRDIKPANILIDRSCEPYLIDFGGAKVSEGAGGSTVSVGTLGFMPPEQRFQQFNKTTDIYSLGMSIVCWLTRTEPTEMYNIINMGTNQVMGLRELLSAYSLRFVDWLEKVVQPNPKDRYPDAEAAFNAFKPLYVKRVPEAIVSSSVLEFTTSKLGERITQTLTVWNNVPETVLEGWWEVVPHPSDPPSAPDSHEWISFKPINFTGKSIECNIVVDTAKLMASKTYNRQIMLYSNSLIETQSTNIIVRTGSLPIDKQTFSYLFLVLSFGFGVIISFLSIIIWGCLNPFLAAFDNYPNKSFDNKTLIMYGAIGGPLTLFLGLIYFALQLLFAFLGWLVYNAYPNSSAYSLGHANAVAGISVTVGGLFYALFGASMTWGIPIYMSIISSIAPVIRDKLDTPIGVFQKSKLEAFFTTTTSFILGVSLIIAFVVNQKSSISEISKILAILSTTILAMYLLAPVVLRKIKISKYHASEKNLIKP